MKWEHKIGIALTCTFLCLVGAVIGLKMREQASPQSSEVAQGNSDEAAEPTVRSPLPSPGGNTSQEASRRVPSPNNDPTLGFTGHEPPPNMGTKVEPPFGKNTGQSGKNDFPTQSLGTTANGIAAKNEKSGAPKSSIGMSNPAIINPPPSPAVELSPHKPPVKGADEWYTSANESKDKKQNASPAAPKDTKTASPLLQPMPDVKTQPAAKQPAPSPILPTSNTELTLAPPQQAPAAQPNAANNAAASLPMFPSYLSKEQAKAPKTAAPKEKVQAPASAPPAQARPPEIAKPVSPLTPAPVPLPSAAPGSAASAMPARAVPVPTVPAPLPASTPPPPLAPAPRPEGISGTFTPAPAPRISSQQGADAPRSPAPPKPPADGSAFVPDNPPPANGPVGVKPAPLPFPVPPPSSPLAATPNKPAPTPLRPASTGTSVTVYDEQDYSCQPGDSWAAISKRFYMTDRYAKALQRHNQNHARASEQMRDTGQVAPGERIFVPQSYVLEQRYGDAIVKPAATTASPTMPVSFPSASPAPAPPGPLNR